MTKHELELTRAARRFTAAAVLVAAAAAVAITAVAYPSVFPAAKPFDPLQFPMQHVKTHVAGVKGPAVKIGGQVRVTGQKCSLARSPVTVTGHYVWQSLRPPGSIIAVGEGVGVRQPGCESFDFVNPMPPGVVAAARAVGGRTTWIITGSETPLAAHGVKRVWKTEPFTIVASP